jgi:hypothetical protein
MFQVLFDMYVFHYHRKALTEPRDASLVISVITFCSSYAFRIIVAASEACSLFRKFVLLLAFSSVEE